MKNDFCNCNTQWRLMRKLLTNNWSIVSDKEGNIRIGECETVVFVSPCKTKALRINNGIWKDFALYVDVARSLPDNSYFQNIGYDFFLDDGTYCVELEPLLEANDPKAPLKSRGQYIILKNLINNPFKSSRTDMIDKILKRDSELREAMRALFSTLQNAHEQDNRFDPFLDLHGRNFMIRPNGDIVLSDPFTRFPDGGSSPEHQTASNILWRRKLGFFDYQDSWKQDWEIKKSTCGYGTLVLD